MRVLHPPLVASNHPRALGFHQGTASARPPRRRAGHGQRREARPAPGRDQGRLGADARSEPHDGQLRQVNLQRAGQRVALQDYGRAARPPQDPQRERGKVSIAVVRVRGTVNINTDTKDALRMLHLTRANHCTIIPENPQWRGTLLKVKDYVTWGPVEEKTVVELLTKRGRVIGGDALTPEYLSKNTQFKTPEDLARALRAQK